MTVVDQNPQILTQFNAVALTLECAWFSSVVEVRLSLYFEQDIDCGDIYELTPPDLVSDQSQLLDIFLIRNNNLDRRFTEFGGQLNKTNGGFLPTLETALILLAGDDLGKRFETLTLFDRDHYFSRRRMLGTT